MYLGLLEIYFDEREMGGGRGVRSRYFIVQGAY